MKPKRENSKMYSKWWLSLERASRGGCGCASLRTGCIITAIVCIVYAVVGLSQCVADAVWAEEGAEGAEEGTGVEGGGEGAGMLHWMYWGVLVCVLSTSLALSVLMMIGALKSKPWMLRPWVWFKAVQLGAAVLFLLVGFTLSPLPTDQPAFILLAVEFFAILVRFYMLTVVVSHCRELEEHAVPLRPARGYARTDSFYSTI